jgi:hypothetical protein
MTDMALCASFDHFVGGSLQGERNRQTKLPRVSRQPVRPIYPDRAGRFRPAP